MTWKIDIVEGLDASLRYQRFQLKYFTIIMVKIRVDLMETDKMKVWS